MSDGQADAKRPGSSQMVPKLLKSKAIQKPNKAQDLHSKPIATLIKTDGKKPMKTEMRAWQDSRGQEPLSKPITTNEQLKSMQTQIQQPNEVETRNKGKTISNQTNETAPRRYMKIMFNDIVYCIGEYLLLRET